MFGYLSDCNKLTIHAMFQAQKPSVWNDQFTISEVTGCTTPSLPPPAPPAPPAPPPPPATAGDDPTFIGTDGAPYHVRIFTVPTLSHDVAPSQEQRLTNPLPQPLTSRPDLHARSHNTCPPTPPQVLGEPWKYFNILSSPNISLNAQVLSSCLALAPPLSRPNVLPQHTSIP